MWYHHPGPNGFGDAESSDGLSLRTQADLKWIKFAGDFTLAVKLDRVVRPEGQTGMAEVFLAECDALFIPGEKAVEFEKIQSRQSQGQEESQMTSDRITIDPLVLGGLPCIRGMPVAVQSIIGMLRDHICAGRNLV